ncbi:MAG: hypothetical protein K0U34_06470 [Alphaproteobacteria bacterium]|nr:hypothetical protein [Alphaproteobacteria bacterium]
MTNANHETPTPHTRPLGEKSYWLDKPANVNKLVYGFYTLCAVILAIDVFFPKHGPFALEHMFGFYGFFGFIACVVLVLVAKQLRRVLMRPEDYYDR